MVGSFIQAGFFALRWDGRIVGTRGMFCAFMHGKALVTYRAGLNFFPWQSRYGTSSGETKPPLETITMSPVWLTTTSR